MKWMPLSTVDLISTLLDKVNDEVAPYSVYTTLLGKACAVLGRGVGTELQHTAITLIVNRLTASLAAESDRPGYFDKAFTFLFELRNVSCWSRYHAFERHHTDDSV